MGSLHLVTEAAFDDLLTRWRHHSSLREVTETPVPQLSESRHQLDEARRRMHMLRAALYPTTSEREEIVVSVLCSDLDEVVHLNWTRRDHTTAGTMTCVCGERFIVQPPHSGHAERSATAH